MATDENIKKYDFTKDGKVSFDDLMGIALDLYKPTYPGQDIVGTTSNILGRLGVVGFLPKLAVDATDAGIRMATGTKERSRYNETVIKTLGQELGLNDEETQAVIDYAKIQGPNSSSKSYEENTMKVVNNLTNIQDTTSLAYKLDRFNFLKKEYARPNSSYGKSIIPLIGGLQQEPETKALNQIFVDLGFKNYAGYGYEVSPIADATQRKNFFQKNEAAIYNRIINDMKTEATKAGINTTNIDWTSPNLTQDLSNLIQTNYVDETGLVALPNTGTQINPEDNEKLTKLFYTVSEIKAKVDTNTGVISSGVGLTTSSVPGATAPGTTGGLGVDNVPTNPTYGGYAPTGATNFYGVSDPNGTVRFYNNETGQVEPLTALYKQGMAETYWSKLSVTERRDLQYQLYASGHYGTNDPVNFNGNITNFDIKAMEAAMGNANLNASTIDDYLKPRYEYYLEFGRPYGEDAVDLDGDGEPDSSNAKALSNMLLRNGLKPDENYIKSFTQQIVAGNLTLQDAMQQIREKTVSGMFPAWKDDIIAGRDVADIANPYLVQIANTFQVPVESLSVNDPRIQKALSYRDDSGKAVPMSMFDFKELVLRNDPAWEDTAEAQAAYEQFGNALSNRWNIR
jgi:hypothetical protein